MKKQMKEKKGITLIALVITIIVLLILAGVTIVTLTGDNGLLTKAGEAKNTSEKEEIREQIKLSYNEWKLQKETGETLELKDIVETNLTEKYDEVNVSKQGKAISIKVKNHEFTLVDDGTMEEGQLAYLDIAEGTIQLDKDGYIQGTNAKVKYEGKYIITGTAKEKYVRVVNEGTYDITIKDLNIDMSTLSWGCPFNANGGGKATGCFVNLTIEGENHFYAGSTGAGIGFTGAIPNVDGQFNGSTLKIDGNGFLEVKGGFYAAGIGAGYGYNYNNNATGNANNIILNSGNIYSEGGMHGASIGPCLGGNATNIIINGGSISSSLKAYMYGIKGTNIMINGGNIQMYGGNECGNVISGKKIEIKNGTIKIENIFRSSSAIVCSYDGSINITGGNIYAKGKNYNIATYEEGTSNLILYTPTDVTNNLYETQIKLQDVGENKQVTGLTTSDKIEYGIKDMYTLEDGMLYLYLPKGSRTINVEVGGKTYSGVVETKEIAEVVTLTETN